MELLVENVDVPENVPVSEDKSFLTLAVLEFAPSTSQETQDWLRACIKTPVCDGGGGLLVRSGYHNLRHCEVLYLSATRERLLQEAEKVKIRKQHKSGFKREFTLDQEEDFECCNGGQILTLAERQRMLLHAVEKIHPPGICSIPGHSSDVKLFKTTPIIPKCISLGIITQLYPLHDAEALKALTEKWYLGVQLPTQQPIDRIKDYFGETIALYFAFLGFYTFALVPPVLAMIVFNLADMDEHIENAIFAVLNLVWSTIFLEAWKRRCAEITYLWGTLRAGIGEDKEEEARPEYYGPIRTSPITGITEPFYPAWKHFLKMYGVSYPVVVLCMKVATVVTLLYFQFYDLIESYVGDQSGLFAMILRLIPSIVYAVVIAVMNAGYHILATKLTSWENHRLESSYNNHLIIKLVLFYFVNSFYSLFYIAFVLNDIELLQTHLAALLITQQIIQQIKESLLPYLMFKQRVTKVSKDGKKIVIKSVKLDSDNPEQEGDLEQFPGTFDDYLELFLQFGYTFLFSSAYPMAAFWSLLNNVVEIRTDAFKLCRIYQRPFAISASSIGAWQLAFEAMSVVAVMTNLALIGLQATAGGWFKDMSAVNIVLMFVFAEHLIIGLKFLLAFVIPDVPRWVEEQLAKENHLIKQALKDKEISLKSGQT